MKRFLLVFATVLIGLTSASATPLNHQNHNTKLDKANRYRYAEPVMFVERGVEFLVFPDGSFDFNTNYQNTFYNDAHFRNKASRRSSINSTYNASGRYVKHTTNRHKNRGVLVSHDNHGKVRRIGNIFLNYDRYGKIKRVGSIYMGYKRNGTLNQVGGLRVKYNHWGEIVFSSGQVSPYSNSCGICGANACSTKHRHNNRYNDNWHNNHVYNNNNDYYYFKKNGKVKKHKKRKR